MSKVERKRSATEALALGVAAGLSLTDVAKQAGLSYMTARRRAAEPVFRQRVEELRQAITDQALGKLTENTTKASDTFVALLSDPNSQVRLAAAKAILDYRSRLKADGELRDKVDRLESIVQELTSHDTRNPYRQDALEGTTSLRPETEENEHEPIDECEPGSDH